MDLQGGESETTKTGNYQSIISYFSEAKKEIPCIPNAPFQILHMYGNKVKRFRQDKIIRPVPGTALHASHSRDFSPHASLSDFSYESLKSIKLTSSLLDAAEKFSNRQFGCVEKLLETCMVISSATDSPIERAVKIFAEALRQRVDIERGRIDLEKKIFPLEECPLPYQPAILACEQKLPSQITQFTAIQAILDSVGSAKRIHLVDFSVKTGLHCSIMMEGLANRTDGSIDLLKITALGASKERLEEAGKRLSSFAESMKLPFLFRSIVSEMNEDELNQDCMKIEPNEVVAVYLGLHLCSKLARPDHLRSFILFIKKLNPCVIVVNEIEANTNTSIFIDRFHEALSFSIAMFDYLDACLKRETIYRKIIEDVFFQDMIQNIVTAEDEERTHRHAKIGFWRKFFAEFNIVETELSDSSLYQASLLIKGNNKWKSSTLQMDGKSMIVGWKGTPTQSISAWKICDEESEHDSS